MSGEADSASTGSVDADRDVLRAMRTQLDELLHAVKRLDERMVGVQRRTSLLPRELLTDIQALQQLLHRYQPEASLPRLAGWALSPTGLLALTDIIDATSARTVVECGSGTSTLWIAYALRRAGGGKVIALEHLVEYAERTQALIEEHGLSWFAEVRLAPLVDQSTPRGVFRWYDIDVNSLPGPIDVLLVDGPPQSTGKHARYPAFPILSDLLAPTARILCDDTDRRDEKEMIQLWLDDDDRLERMSPPAPDLELLRFRGKS